jgi:hypothetical protein
MYNKKMEPTSYSQLNPTTEQQKKEDIFFDDVRNFLDEVEKKNSNYTFTIDEVKIENSQIKLTYHPEKKNMSLNDTVDEWLKIHLCALGYEGSDIEKIKNQNFDVRRRVVAVGETRKKQTALQAQLSIAHKKNLQLQTQNTSLRRQKEAVDEVNKNLEEKLSMLNTGHANLELHIDQTKSQNETLKSLNTENSERIAKIQGKLNDVLQELQQELREKCPHNFKNSGVSQD